MPKVSPSAEEVRLLAVTYTPSEHSLLGYPLVEVEPNPNGPWDAETQVKIGDFETTEEALSFIRQSMLEEGWDEEEPE
jgi:hypothetical protein